LAPAEFHAPKPLGECMGQRKLLVRRLVGAFELNLFLGFIP
jgi:hypothetical protein